MKPRFRDLPALVAAELAQTPGPVGSGAILERLLARGVATSRPTVSRALDSLTRRGFAEKVSNKGRTITATGRTWLERTQARRAAFQSSDRVLRAVGRSTLTELRNAMLARRGLEAEMAREAAERATPEQVATLQRIAEAQAKDVEAGGRGAQEALDFHQTLAEASGNRFIAAALRLIRTSAESLEALMFHLGATIGGDSRPAHAELVAAIADRDGERAAAAAAAHIDEFIRHIDQWLAGLGPDDAGRGAPLRR